MSDTHHNPGAAVVIMLIIQLFKYQQRNPHKLYPTPTTQIAMAALSTFHIVPLWRGMAPIILYPLSIGFVALVEYYNPPSAECQSYA